MISPRLAVRSPMKRCGKTTLLDVLGCLVMKALPTANVSAAALFRVVEGYRPCLLVDEADTFLAESDDLRGVLNSGHRRGGSVLRTVGDDHEPRAFATYAAVAIGLIGTLPDTLADRSISVDLKRKLSSEVTESFRIDRVGHLEVLARKAARWASDNADADRRGRSRHATRRPQPGGGQLAAAVRHRGRGGRRMAEAGAGRGIAGGGGERDGIR